MMQKSKMARTLLLSTLLALALVALAGCQLMGSGGEAAVDAPVVVVQMTDTGLNVPAEVPSGVVSFELSAAPGALVGRLNEGVTLEQLNEALANSDPFAALGLVSLLGGGRNATDGVLTVDLKPGAHAFINLPEDGSPSVAGFSAGEASGAAAPEPDVTVDLVDFSFVAPSQIETGPKVWQITNKGTQWHEMSILKLSEGASVEDVLAMIQSEEPPDGPLPFEAVAFWAPNSPGETGWVTWDLPPGEYTVICFLPDLAGDMSPHAAHGMVAQLTVTE